MIISEAEIDRCARIVWDYHHMNHSVAPADCILALGSHDTRVAERAAQLYLDGYAPLVVMSGGLGNLTLGKWERPEARVFADIAIAMGVPEERILCEDQSTNTGENIRFSKILLAEKNIQVDKYIAVQKPYMERRSFATFKVWLPDADVVVTSPQLSFDEYPTGEISRDKVITVMVGDLQRLREYPSRGLMIEQPIPDDVWNAFEQLVAAGYTGNLVKAQS